MEIQNTTHIIRSASYIKQSNSTDQKEKESDVQSLTSDKEKLEIEKLKREDKRVRMHEAAHKAAAGSLAKGQPNYKYKIGPDGKKYAVAGHVQIDISEVPDNPEATLRKAQKIKSAALAPAEPSAQDIKVAAEASRMEAKARSEISKEKLEKSELTQNQQESEIQSNSDKSILPKIDFYF